MPKTLVNKLCLNKLTNHAIFKVDKFIAPNKWVIQKNILNALVLTKAAKNDFLQTMPKLIQLHKN